MLRPCPLFITTPTMSMDYHIVKAILLFLLPLLLLGTIAYIIIVLQVIQIPIADCSSRSDCTSCLGNGNPLCGWCVVENKCSQESECQNPETRWIRAAGTNTDQCTMISITPQQFDLDAPEIVRLTFSS